MDQILRISLDLNDKSENRYETVYQIANLAKKLIDEQVQKVSQDEFGYEAEAVYNTSIKKEKPIQHAIMVKSSESDDSGLVG